MKKKRTIAIRDPKLQKIRNNLRKLLLKWKSIEWNQLCDIYEKIQFDVNDNVRDLSEKEQQQVRDLRMKMKEINLIASHSICKCALCSASERDMTYNPVRKRWYCVDCYQKLQHDFKGEEESVLYP